MARSLLISVPNDNLSSSWCDREQKASLPLKGANAIGLPQEIDSVRKEDEYRTDSLVLAPLWGDQMSRDPGDVA